MQMPDRDQIITGLFLLGVALSVLGILVSTFASPRRNGTLSGYKPPVVKSATWHPSECMLRMKVATSHTRHIDEMSLPQNSYISDIKRNKLYLVECPISIPGSDVEESAGYDIAEDWARANGFDGKVQTA
jgi:hypothetical protein